MLIFEVICVPAKTAKISTPRKFPPLQYEIILYTWLCNSCFTGVEESRGAAAR